MTAPDQTPSAPDFTLFYDAPVAMVWLTPDGRIQHLNTLAYGLLKLPPEPQDGRRFAGLLPTALQPTFTAFLKQVAAGAAAQTLETQLTQRDGTTIDVRVDLVAGRIAGQLTHFHLVLTDITVYKQAHQTLLDGHAALDLQIERGTTQNRVLNDELEQVMAAVIQGLSLPASCLMSAVGRLRQGQGAEAGREDTPMLVIERASQQLMAILQSVERYMQARNFRSRIRPVALKQVLRDVLKKSKPLLANRQVQITHDPLPVIQSCGHTLTLILEEYVANALKYTRSCEAARIHIRVQELELEYVISVEDNGVGFDMRQKERLFGLFQRQHPSSQYESFGLGLALVRRVAERFGGRAWGEGVVDQGATFSFSCPKPPTFQG
ncbi:ATP-binding protein [Deinococcus oregonensis]|uniref:histidine kinase n=1 Tax=Deinococcus oregonensis TaxID=1805970 RepID=A0ABV6ASF1_9DEIO